MNESILKQLTKDYALKRQRAIQNSKKIINELYENNPKLLELKSMKDMLAIQTSKKLLNCDELSKQIELENLEIKINDIEKKINKELAKMDINSDDLKPKFECELCEDTGLLTYKNETKYCSCIMQKVIDKAYNQSSVYKLNQEKFECFDIGYYSSKTDAKKYGIDKSPLENIQKVKEVSMDFIKNMNSINQKNLLFTGNTGLGKTFLANCIANEVIKNGNTVVYQTAPVLMDLILEYKFSYNKDSINKEQYNRIFEVDLLIIDDLGTETMSNHKFTELFNIINTRLLNNKKTIISTNLTISELYKEYDERVMSRLIGNFLICKFIGEDIRLKKKKIGI